MYPREVEEFILQCEAVRDVAVYGIKDEVFGEQVCSLLLCSINSLKRSF